MNQKNFSIKNPGDIIFPDESYLFVDEILKKYNLMKTQEQLLNDIYEMTNVNDIKEASKNLPGTKIAKLIREYAGEKVVPERLSLRLKEDLNVSTDVAMQIAKDLEKSIFAYIMALNKDSAKIKPPFSSEVTSKKTTYKIKRSPSETISDSTKIALETREKNKSINNDMYREEIE
jgi:hypothetical protein